MRTIPIRRSLLFSVLLLSGVLAATLLITFTLGARRVVRTLTSHVIEHTAEQTEGRLHRFFGRVADVLKVTRAWGEFW